MWQNAAFLPENGIFDKFRGKKQKKQKKIKKFKKKAKKQLTRGIEMWYYSQADEREDGSRGQNACETSRLKIE